jgi:uncharacterized protein
MRRIIRHILSFFFSLALCSAALAELSAPALQDRVTDLAGVLSANQRSELGGLLARYENETGHQVVILTVPSLNGESIERFSLRMAKRWAVGHKGLDNGIVVVLVPNDRKVRIELGKGFEPYISNQTAAAIVQTRMIPPLRTKNHMRALMDGVNAVMVEGRKYVIPLNKRPSRQAGKVDMSLSSGAPRLTTQR